MIKFPKFHVGLVYRDQTIRYNRSRWSGKTNWRQLRIIGGWCLLAVWQTPHWGETK